MKHVSIWIWGYIARLSLEYLTKSPDINQEPFFLVLVCILILTATFFAAVIVGTGVISETWDMLDKKSKEKE